MLSWNMDAGPFGIAAAQSSSLAGDVPANVASHLRLAQQAATRGVHLLVFPELSLTGYELSIAHRHVLDPHHPLLVPFKHIAADACMAIVAGAPLRGESGVLHIGALAFLPDGKVAVYTKQHVHQTEQHVFTSGKGGSLLQVGNTQVALAICADASFPQHAATAAAQGAHLYAAGVMIDDAGFPRKTALLRQYASAHAITVLMANYAGITGGEISAGKSAIWAEDGAEIVAAPDTHECLVIARRRYGAWQGEVVPSAE
ncbi:MAG: carbon-nitrogen hydrolase family protein [Bryobacterales bacterium]|nr:carbon-nitrogen hydrolase family protein [Bryobacterales bacterium]